MARSLSIGLLSVLLICMSMKNVVSFNKYGRTCQDIGCRSDEVCELVSDCDTSPDRCGTYPTCKKSDKSGGLNCATKICPSGEYCKTVSGIPTCVNSFSGSAPAGRRPSGVRRRPIKPIRPTPPPRTSSFGFGNRYPDNYDIMGNRDPTRNRGYPSKNSGERDGWKRMPDSNQRDRDYYNTHVSTDKQGNRVWTFSG